MKWNLLYIGFYSVFHNYKEKKIVMDVELLIKLQMKFQNSFQK